MVQHVINIGTTVNDQKGDPIRTAFSKVNQNFDELFSQSAKLVPVPSSSVGSPGDTAGLFAANSTHLYYCTRNYVDSNTNIWVRLMWSADIW